jgi:hypothetical protein
LIGFGGLDEPEAIRKALSRDRVVAAAIGNALSHREHALQRLRAALTDLPLRPPQYAPLSTIAPWS